MQNEKPQDFHFVLPSRSLSYEKLVQGESNAKYKAAGFSFCIAEPPPKL